MKEQEEIIAMLKEQVNKMKNCGNCEKCFIIGNTFYCDLDRRYAYWGLRMECDQWQMKGGK